jgi:PAS domain S-box-containing protein
MVTTLPPHLGVIFEHSPLAQLLIEAEEPFTILAVSDGYQRMTGLERASIACKSIADVFSGAAGASLLASLRRVVAAQTPEKLQIQKGVTLCWNTHNTPVPGPDGSVAYILHSLEDPDKNEFDAFLVRLDDATRTVADPDEIVAITARMLVQELNVDRCTHSTYDADQGFARLSLRYVRPGAPPVEDGLYKIALFGPHVFSLMQTDLPFIVHDSEADEATAENVENYRRFHMRALIAAPLHKNGRLVYSITVTDCTKPRNWRPEEVALVRTVANRCWESVERSRVTSELKASEQRLRLAQRAARIGTFECIMKDERIIWTPELQALYGLPEVPLDQSVAYWRSLIDPEDFERFRDQITSAVARQESECVYDFRAKLPGGELRWMRGRAQIFYDASGAAESMIGVNIDISAQKQAQADLEESLERLRAIFDGTHQYIALLSSDGVILEANRPALECGGNSIQELRGMPYWDGPWFGEDPQTRENVKQAVCRAAAGEFVRFEAAGCGPTMTSRIFDLSFFPIRNQHGVVTMIVPEAHDITERKLAEERLLQQWHTFDTALSNSPDLTYTFDTQGRFTYANKKLCEVSQRPLKDTVGKTPAELGYPSDLANRIQSQIEQVIKTRTGVRDQTAFRLRTGEVREYEYLYEPVIGESGEVEAIAGATRDVTERKEAEELLRKSERQFRQLFDALPQLVWSAMPNGHEDLFNRQWFQYTGLSYSETSGDGSKIIHPEDLPLAAERWQRSLATGQPYEIEYRCRRYDGQYRWFLGRANPVLDEQGQVVRWFGTCTDIHDKKESETALLKAHRQLEEFSYVASHDLQEPLRMVNIYSQLMLKQVGSASGDLGLYSGYVRQGVKRMETLLSDLLSFSRIVQSEPENSPSDGGIADLSAALEEARSVLATRIQETSALITSDPLPLVQGDTRQVAHIFQNLISNALKYRKAGLPPEIRISVTGNDKEWIVSFEDNGIGFEPQYAERIFGLFKRLHKDDYPGTGLGLAICQRIVERYGGRIWAEGRPGEGSTFHVALQKPVS